MGANRRQAVHCVEPMESARLRHFVRVCYIGVGIFLHAYWDAFMAVMRWHRIRRGTFGFWTLAVGIALGLQVASGCAVRQRQSLPPAALVPVWQQATLEELLEKIRTHQDAVQTLQATVEIEPSVTSLQKREIVQYRDIRAFLLVRRPAFLRMIGQYPVLRTTAFDLSSNGEDFQLYVPSKNRFIIGKSRGEGHSESALENLRPQHVLEALLWEAPETGQEQAVLEAASEGERKYYIVHILRSMPGGRLDLARNLWFERQGMTLERLQIFAANGEEITDARYSDYGEFSGVAYAQKITMDRPQDNYGLTLTFSKLVFNQPIETDKFHLEQPAGTEQVNLEKQSISGKAKDNG